MRINPSGRVRLGVWGFYTCSVWCHRTVIWPPLWLIGEAIERQRCSEQNSGTMNPQNGSKETLHTCWAHVHLLLVFHSPSSSLWGWVSIFMYNNMWESVCLRNACKRGLEYYPVPNGVCLNSSGDKNVLSVLAIQLIAMGFIWSE